MPLLGRWFEQEYARLRSEGKAALVDRFEPLLDYVAAGQGLAAMSSMPDLYALADALGEPIWRVVVDYYAGTGEVSWRGNLTTGLDLITYAELMANRLVGAGHVLEIHLREALLYAWLNVDGPGYVPDILTAIDEMAIGEMGAALAIRFELLRAYTTACNGDLQAACEQMLRVLSRMDWPAPYQYRHQGCVLVWMNRLDEAAECYRLAVLGYEEQGMTIDANSARLDLGETLLALDEVEEGLNVLQAALSAAEHSPNVYQVAKAQALIGRGLASQGEPEMGVQWLSQALGTLDGLGWLRSEAELALEHLGLLALMDVKHSSSEWQQARAGVEKQLGKLRSKDLGAYLANLDN
ncbi:MAG: hypothetical protein JXB30_00200 [Anaerolineae bacterium]|nr:hypothetical protein [Anaerolineae bacterium]